MSRKSDRLLASDYEAVGFDGLCDGSIAPGVWRAMVSKTAAGRPAKLFRWLLAHKPVIDLLADFFIMRQLFLEGLARFDHHFLEFFATN